MKQQLEYRSASQGTLQAIVDRFYPSSKTCSGCGDKGCAMRLDRDENAARNILTEDLRSTESSSETYAYGERSSCNITGQCETALAEVGINQHVGPVYMSKY